MRSAGCAAKATPAVAAAEGWVWIVSRLAAAGLTTMVVEVAPAKPGLLKLIVILVAMLCARSVNLIRPAMAVRLVVPCNAALPPAWLPVTTVVLSLLRRLPNWSSIRITGCWAKGVPAVAEADGWVCSVKWSAVAGLTVKRLLSALLNPLALALSWLLVPA